MPRENYKSARDDEGCKNKICAPWGLTRTEAARQLLEICGNFNHKKNKLKQQLYAQNAIYNNLLIIWTYKYNNLKGNWKLVLPR